jgi:hypothetical protein
MKSYILIVSLYTLLVPVFTIEGLTVTIAPIDYYPAAEAIEKKVLSVRYNNLLKEQLDSYVTWSNCGFKLLDESIATPRSFLDAMKLTSEYELDYII